jgi:hypothetical protein
MEPGPIYHSLSFEEIFLHITHGDPLAMNVENVGSERTRHHSAIPWFQPPESEGASIENSVLGCLLFIADFKGISARNPERRQGIPFPILRVFCLRSPHRIVFRLRPPGDLYTPPPGFDFFI